MHLTTKVARLFTFWILLTLLAVCSYPFSLHRPTIALTPGRAVAQTAIEQESIDRLLNSDTAVTASFELQNESVVTHQIATRSPELSRERVEVASPAALGYEEIVSVEQRDFESRAAKVAPDAHVVTELRKLVNAVSMTGPGYQIARVAALSGVKNFWVDRTYHAMLDKSVPLINAPVLWNKLGGAADAGRGIKIAIIDSGIDITNPLFSGTGFVAPAGFPQGVTAFTNNKVIVAKSFLPGGNTSPQDLLGHGTAVAGIAAGNLNTPTPLGPISGVAPGAYLGNYCVLDANNNADPSLTASAVEQAFTDGFDIASLSLGLAASATPGILDDAVEVAIVGGMTVVTAAGNAGASGKMTITSPGTVLNAITVAASSNSHVVGPALNVVGPGQVPHSLQGIVSAAGMSCGPPAGLPIGPLALFDVALLDGTHLGCKAGKLPAGSLAGKIALMAAGNCSLVQKINNAAAAGAVAAIIYGVDISQSPGGSDNDTAGADIPSVLIGKTNGVALKSWVDANPGAPIAITGPTETATIPDILAPFSSLGPSVQGTLKPDLAAPGENIYSGAIRSCNDAVGAVSDPSGFLAASGTSQAAAHVVGAAALIKQLHPTWTVAQVKSALVNGADGQVLASESGSAVAGILSVGAGRIDLAQASSVNATLAPASLSFGVNKLKQLGHSVTLVQTLNITSVAASTANFKVAINWTPVSGVTITQSAKTVSISPGQTVQEQITIAAKKNAQTGDLTGFVTVTSSGQTLNVPFWVRL